MIYNAALLPLLLSLLFLSLVVLWIAVTNRKNFLVTFMVIPLTLASATVSYFTVDNLLGYPVQETIPNDSVYISHLASDEVIYVWVMPPESMLPRAYSIEKTEKNLEAMEEAQAGQDAGRSQMIGEVEESVNGQTQGGEYESYDFNMERFEYLKGKTE